MGQFKVKESWLSVIERQEKTLVLDSFDREDALEIGLRIIALAKDKYRDAITVSIEIDNNIVFSYMMPGMSLEKKLWMLRKGNVSKATGASSLHACVEIELGKYVPSWEDQPDAFVACGGCWPVRVTGQNPFAYVAVSGLEHYLDHQIIVDALSEYTGKKVESIKL